MQCQLVTRPVRELRPHPRYIRHRIAVSARQTSSLIDQGEAAFCEPLIVTQDRFIIDGYARWELARTAGRETLSCIEYQLTEEEGLQMLIRRHRRSTGVNDFCRILLALELEPWLRDKAESNQRYGGHNKGSSRLTEADKLDVRRLIADDAGVSVGNVSKVKQLTSTAHPEVVAALRSGEIRIHRAWLWSKAPLREQLDRLRTHRIEGELKKTARTLISRQLGEVSEGRSDLPSPTLADLDILVRLISTPEDSRIGPVTMAVVEAPGNGIFLTEQLFQSLQSLQESHPLC